MGFLLALFTAIAEASRDLVLSGSTAKKVSPILRAWTMLGVTLPLVAIVSLATGVQLPRPEFWWLVTAHSVLMASAHILYMRALTLGPVSQTQPLLALTTVFLVITNPLMTKETVSLMGWLGVVAVGLGVYGTSHPGEGGWTSPFAAMVRQPGVKSKLGVAAIFSVTANLDRLCVDAAKGSGVTYLLADLVFTWLLLTAVITWQHRWKEVRSLPRLVLIVSGLGNATSILLYITTLSYLPVPFLIAIKRLSIVFTSLYGYLVRRERRPRWYHLVGIVMVSLGIFLIQLSR